MITPLIYLPNLPSLSSDDLALYSAIHNARIDLVTQLSASGFHIPNVDGQHAWLKTMLRHAQRSNAFLFPPMTSLPEHHPKYQSEAAQRWFEFFSLITGVHVGSREKYLENGLPKPCIVIDPDGQWKAAIDLLRDLHAKGMFSSRVEDIVQVVGEGYNTRDYHSLNKLAATHLRQSLAREKPQTQRALHSRFPDTHVFDSFRTVMPRHPFGIAIFGSATTAVEAYKQATSDLACQAGERGWRMVTGAGVDGCMGAADHGFSQGRARFNARHPSARYKPAHVGVSTQAILRLEGPPKQVDQLIVTDDIYDRMKIMIRGNKSQNEKIRTRDAVKVLFVAPGGTGTVQEFATLMQLATNGDMMQGRAVVLLNLPSHLNPQEGFWKPLIDTAERLGFSSLFHVAHTVEQAIAMADEAYAKWLERHEDLRTVLPHPVFNP